MPPLILARIIAAVATGSPHVDHMPPQRARQGTGEVGIQRLTASVILRGNVPGLRSHAPACLPAPRPPDRTTAQPHPAPEPPTGPPTSQERIPAFWLAPLQRLRPQTGLSWPEPAPLRWQYGHIQHMGVHLAQKLHFATSAFTATGDASTGPCSATAADLSRSPSRSPAARPAQGGDLQFVRQLIEHLGLCDLASMRNLLRDGHRPGQITFARIRYSRVGGNHSVGESCFIISATGTHPVPSASAPSPSATPVLRHSCR